MKPYDLFELLRGHSYPGRGILLGVSPDGLNAVIAYFIMGRSENSRNRIFVSDGDGIKAEAYDPSKIEDPSLIIYQPVRCFENTTIVTNGDQTDTIFDGMTSGIPYSEALCSRTFEPDSPHYTPRISGILERSFGKVDYHLSILKSQHQGEYPGQCIRTFFDYQGRPGLGHLLHTYQEDTHPLPSFQGEPRPVAIEGTMDTLSHGIWESLNGENKVSLFVRLINLGDGSHESRIFNKNHGQ